MQDYGRNVPLLLELGKGFLCSAILHFTDSLLISASH